MFLIIIKGGSSKMYVVNIVSKKSEEITFLFNNKILGSFWFVPRSRFELAHNWNRFLLFGGSATLYNSLNLDSDVQH